MLFRSGVDKAVENRLAQSNDPFDLQGAGDQGLMFGYATRDTKELMPLPIAMAHHLAERLSLVRKNGELNYLRPDGKTQVTIEYDGDRPVSLDTVVISSQHSPDVDIEGAMTRDLTELVIKPVIKSFSLKSDSVKILVNPTGRFVIGGPMGDAGLTGRKIIVDRDRKSTRLNSSHVSESRMPSSA